MFIINTWVVVIMNNTEDGIFQFRNIAMLSNGEMSGVGE
jgi:hypothetical protein